MGKTNYTIQNFKGQDVLVLNPEETNFYRRVQFGLTKAKLIMSPEKQAQIKEFIEDQERQ